MPRRDYHSQAYACYYASILHALRGELVTAQRYAERCIALSEEHGFRQWRGLAQDGLSLGRVARGGVQREARVQHKGRAAALAGAQDDALGRLAGARPQRDHRDAHHAEPAGR